MSDELGGGSLTALPIAETDAGNLSAYIPTNLISITDGQIVLDSKLFAANHRPAIDIGLSVSRVGGKAQKAALRQASGRIRLDYAQFMELEMFTRFGGISDTRVNRQITRGERIRALLSQPRFAVISMVGEVAMLRALDAGIFDPFPPALVPRVKAAVEQHLGETEPGLVAALQTGEPLDEASDTALVDAVRQLAEQIAIQMPEKP